MCPDIVGFIHELRHDDLPGDVVAQSRRLLTDLVGVATAGSATPMSRIVRDHAVGHLRGDTHQARLLFDGRSVSPGGAALANASTIDAMDGHDGHRLTKGHAGAAVLPAALAVLTDAAGATTRDLLTSLVVGYEVAGRAGIALHAGAADYHSSGAWNAVGAAAVGARALRLDGRETEHALGIAEYHAPRAPMMRCIDHPSMVKDSSGWGAHAGVSAALLASDGFTGPPAALVTTDDGPAGELWHDLGRRWTILEQYVKPYPVCRWAQPAVEGVLGLVRTAGVRPDAIRTIDVTTFHSATRLTARTPATTEEAQYSLPFAVAAAAVHRELTPEVVAHPDQANGNVRRLATGMRVSESPAMTAAFPGTRLAEVTVVLDDGSRLSSGPLEAAGEPERPLGADVLAAKFLASAGPVLGESRAHRLLQLLAALDDHELADVLDELYAPSTEQAGLGR